MNEITDKAIKLVRMYDLLTNIKADVEYWSSEARDIPVFLPEGISIIGIKDFCSEFPRDLNRFAEAMCKEMCEEINKIKDKKLALIKDMIAKELLADN